MKDIRCLFGHHKYAANDMVLERKAERDGYVVYSSRLRCARCGHIREDEIMIPMPQKNKEGQIIVHDYNKTR